MGHTIKASLVAPVGDGDPHIAHTAGTVAVFFHQKLLLISNAGLLNSAQMQPWTLIVDQAVDCIHVQQ
jgi:hypothetical protein